MTRRGVWPCHTVRAWGSVRRSAAAALDFRFVTIIGEGRSDLVRRGGIVEAYCRQIARRHSLARALAALVLALDVHGIPR